MRQLRLVEKVERHIRPNTNIQRKPGRALPIILNVAVHPLRIRREVSARCSEHQQEGNINNYLSMEPFRILRCVGEDRRRIVKELERSIAEVK